MKLKLSVHAKDVMANRQIDEVWIYRIIANPSRTIVIEENEVHLYGTIDEYNERCLKVVINPLNSVIITTYFDRRMKKKGGR